jgi:hypothetical protein
LVGGEAAEGVALFFFVLDCCVCVCVCFFFFFLRLRVREGGKGINNINDKYVPRAGHALDVRKDGQCRLYIYMCIVY